MDHHIKEYYCQFHDDSPRGNFHKVISLNDPHANWEMGVQLVPKLCKGWYELTRLSIQDRIEFMRDFWLTKLSYHSHLDEFLTRFFASLDDIVVYLIQKKFDDPYEAHLVYSLKDNNGFFRGSLPALDQEIVTMQKNFPGITFPKDYLAFLQIHNGFCKTTDCTGLYPSAVMKENYLAFQEILKKEDALTTTKGQIVDPAKLIPFYESFGMPYYQCFWAEWYPEQEMGNVYYSSTAHTISAVDGKEAASDSMAFTTFLDWLMFYMERVT